MFVSKKRHQNLERDYLVLQSNFEDQLNLLNNMAAESYVLLRALLDLSRIVPDLRLKDRSGAAVPSAADERLLSHLCDWSVESALKPYMQRAAITGSGVHGDTISPWLEKMCAEFDPHGHVRSELNAHGPSRQLVIRAFLYWFSIGMAGGFSIAPSAYCDELSMRVLKLIPADQLSTIRAVGSGGGGTLQLLGGHFSQRVDEINQLRIGRQVQSTL